MIRVAQSISSWLMRHYYTYDDHNENTRISGTRVYKRCVTVYLQKMLFPCEAKEAMPKMRFDVRDVYSFHEDIYYSYNNETDAEWTRIKASS